MRKNLTYMGGIAAILLIATVLVLGQVRLVPVEAQEPQTTTVQRITLSTTVESTGSIAPARTGALAFNTSGRVLAVLVEVGDRVQAGQELAQLDTDSLEYQISLREQSFIVQQTSYDRLVAEATPEQIAQAQASLASAQSQLRSAQSSLENATNQETINCTNLASRQRQLDDAQDDYDSYVKQGYAWDATFMPDPNSSTGRTLRDAQSAYDVEAAQCRSTTSTAQYQLQVEAAEASVIQAQAALESLLSGPTTEEVAAQQAQLEQARLELENARNQLADAVLTAPFNGVISEVNLVIGQLVNSGVSAMTLIDDSRLHIDVDVDELDIALITVGQPAVVTPDALNGTRVDGMVQRIAPTGTVRDGIVTYQVRVELPDIANLPVRVGMTTEVAITVASEGDVLAVPTQAVQREGITEFVEVYNTNGENRRVTVTTGQVSDGMTEISGQVREGDVIVIPVQTPQSAGGGLGGPPFGGGGQ